MSQELLSIATWSREDSSQMVQWLEDAPEIFWKYLTSIENDAVERALNAITEKDADIARGVVSCARKVALIHDRALENLQANTQEDIDRN